MKSLHLLNQQDGDPAVLLPGQASSPCLHKSPSLKFCLFWYKIHYDGRESKNIFMKKLHSLDKGARFFQEEGKE